MNIGFDGYALGGLSVGEGKTQRQETIAHTLPLLPDDKPRYLMGLGTPEDLVEGVVWGRICLIASCRPAMPATGCCLPGNGPVIIKKAEYADDPQPVGSGMHLLYLSKLFPGLSSAFVFGQGTADLSFEHLA